LEIPSKYPLSARQDFDPANRRSAGAGDLSSSITGGAKLFHVSGNSFGFWHFSPLPGASATPWMAIPFKCLYDYK